MLEPSAVRPIPLLLAAALSLPGAALAQGAAEEIGSWRLACTTDRMTDRTSCILRHRDPVERAALGAGLILEILDRNGQLVPAVTARDLSIESAQRALLALTGTAQIRFDRNPLIEMPCGLEGRSLVCAPRPADAARAAAELPGAERALVRMTGMGSGSTAASEPAELRLAETRAATERLRRAQPAGTAPPPPPPGVDLRELLGRAQRLLQ
jgi:hypothetical protein